jgi:hypothetical protein
LGSLPQFENRVRVISIKEYRAARETVDTLTRGFLRPEPLNYDPGQIYNDLGKDVLFAVVRWDRIVFTSCRSLVELKAALGMIGKVLRGRVSRGEDVPGVITSCRGDGYDKQ